MRTVDPKKREAKTQAILKAAIGCFRKHGFHQTGMAEICKAAKTSPGALYHYFKGKDEIIQAIAEQEQREVNAYFEVLRASKNFKKSLFEFITEVIKEACHRPDNILSTEIFAEGTRNKNIAKIIEKSEGVFLDGLTSILKEASEQEKIVLTLSPEETAKTLMIFIYGTSTMALIARDLNTKQLIKLTEENLSYILQGKATP
ncbi:TetR/AcrR family transcriptional regulator [Curvivirga aplysinae]|uniref:TetR/AcrR family transcriptional regulator n=1 Tax=Curvivirga aplysinae TaxID=2529852 RepID=UPI0012BD629A|nr:TetR/AcrR family transcriptional regulator [Curvivirga aplysinae]MTI09904.1 TetR/AcrR family transcriptional regulator [Curvivirga aplysinae]